VEQVVKESSACIDGCTKIALDLDHLHLNRFTDQDDLSYKKVRPEIKKMVEKAPASIKRRLNGNLSSGPLKMYQLICYH
jgi:hypothetical protein